MNNFDCGTVKNSLQEGEQSLSIFENYGFEDLDLLITQYPKALEPAPLICKVIAILAMLLVPVIMVLSFIDDNIGMFFIALLIFFISYAIILSPFALAANVVKKGFMFLINSRFSDAVYFFEKAFAFHIYNFLTKEERFWLNNIIFYTYAKMNAYDRALSFVTRKICIDKSEQYILFYHRFKKYRELVEYVQTNYDYLERQENPIMLILLSEAFMEMGQNGAALQALLQGHPKRQFMDPQMCMYRYALAKCYEVNGNKKAAMEQYQKVCGFDINYKDAEERLSNLNNEFKIKPM